MTTRKSRSGASRNEYSTPPITEGAPAIIRFSEAERFSVIFSPALIFPLVLSFVSRQRKEHYQGDRPRSSQIATFGDSCSLSFARPKVLQSHGGCDVFEIITIMECRCLAAKAFRFSEHLVLPKVWLCLRIEF